MGMMRSLVLDLNTRRRVATIGSRNGHILTNGSTEASVTIAFCADRARSVDPAGAELPPVP